MHKKKLPRLKELLKKKKKTSRMIFRAHGRLEIVCVPPSQERKEHLIHVPLNGILRRVLPQKGIRAKLVGWRLCGHSYESLTASFKRIELIPSDLISFQNKTLKYLRNIKISSTQKYKIHNIWNPKKKKKNYQACKETQEEKSISRNRPRNDTDDRISTQWCYNCYYKYTLNVQEGRQESSV